MIQELTILSKEGIPLFHYNFQENSNKNPNYQIIASYFEQICRFAKFGFKESLNCLRLDKSAFYFYTHPKSQIHVICKCPVEIDNNKAKRKLLDYLSAKILERFFDRFEKYLANFDGNISRFKVFTSELFKIKDLKGMQDSGIFQMT